MERKNSPGCNCDCCQCELLNPETMPNIYINGWNMVSDWDFSYNPYCPFRVFEPNNPTTTCTDNNTVVMQNTYNSSCKSEGYAYQNAYFPGYWYMGPSLNFLCDAVVFDKHCCVGSPEKAWEFEGVYSVTEKWRTFYKTTPKRITVELSLNCKTCVVDGVKTVEKVWVVSSRYTMTVQVGYRLRLEVSATETVTPYKCHIDNPASNAPPCTKTYTGVCDYENCNTSSGAFCYNETVDIDFYGQKIYPFSTGLPTNTCISFSSSDYLDPTCQLGCCFQLNGPPPEEDCVLISLDGLTNPCWCTLDAAVEAKPLVYRHANPCWYPEGTSVVSTVTSCSGSTLDPCGTLPEWSTITCPSLGPQYCWTWYGNCLTWTYNLPPGWPCGGLGQVPCVGHGNPFPPECDNDSFASNQCTSCFNHVLEIAKRCQCESPSRLVKTGGNVELGQLSDCFTACCSMWVTLGTTAYCPTHNPAVEDPPTNPLNCLLSEFGCVTPSNGSANCPATSVPSWTCCDESGYNPKLISKNWNLWCGTLTNDILKSASVSCSGFNPDPDIKICNPGWGVCFPA